MTNRNQYEITPFTDIRSPQYIYIIIFVNTPYESYENTFTGMTR